MRLIFPIGIFAMSICIAIIVVLLVDTSALFYWAAQQQRSFQNAMAGSLRAIRAGDGLALWSLCSLTFAYGFVHAIGPGHGKILLGGAALSSQSTLRRMAALTLVSSLAQSLMAVIIVVGGISLLSLSSADTVNLTEKWLAPISYGAIALIGLYLSVRAGRQFWRLSRPTKHNSNDDHHKDGCDCGHRHGPSIEEIDALRTWHEMAVLVASIAIRPCTGALFLLVIAWRFQILPAGVLAAFTMGLGTAAFNLVFAGSGVGLRGLLSLADRTTKGVRYLPAALQMIGGLLIVFLSSGMLLQTL